MGSTVRVVRVAGPTASAAIGQGPFHEGRHRLESAALPAGAPDLTARRHGGGPIRLGVAVARLIDGGEGPAPPAARVHRHPAVERVGVAEHLAQQPHRGEVNLAEGLGRFALGGEHPAGPQDAAAVLEEGAVEQALSRSGRIGAVHDHHVVAGGLGLAHPGDAIAHREVEAGVAPAATADRGKMLLAPLHHQAIDLHHVEVLHAGMAQALAGGAAVAAADHQHPFNPFGAAEGRVHDCLVVVPFLAFGGHPAAVEQQAFAVTLAFDDRDPLEGGIPLGDHPTGKAVAHAIEDLIHPLGAGIAGSGDRGGAHAPEAG